MRISFAGVLAEAWAIARADGDLLLRVAAPFLFLPAFALTLFVPPMPVPEDGFGDLASRAAWFQQVEGWVDSYGFGVFLAYAVTYFGAVTIVALYCDPARPTVGQALARVLRLYPRILLAMILIALPAGLGMWLILPGLYILGRTMLTAPVLVAEAPVSAWRAIRRSLALSRGGGSGLSLMALVAFAYCIGLLGGQPFLMLDGWMRGQGGGNILAIAVVDAAAALVGMVAQLAAALFAVVAYRRLAK